MAARFLDGHAADGSGVSRQPGRCPAFCTAGKPCLAPVPGSSLFSSDFIIGERQGQGKVQGKTQKKQIGEDGHSLRTCSAAPFHFDAHHYGVKECQQAKHDHELLIRPETVLHLDAAHAPIDSEMAWSIKMPEALAVKGEACHLSVEIELS